MKCEMNFRVVCEVADFEKLPMTAAMELGIEEQFKYMCSSVLGDLYRVREVEVKTVSCQIATALDRDGQNAVTALFLCGAASKEGTRVIHNWSWLDRSRRECIDSGAVIGRGGVYTITEYGKVMLEGLLNDKG